MQKVFGSALIQFLITLGTALMAIWDGVDTFSAIAPTTYAIAFIGAGLAGLKDVQAYLAKSPKDQ